MVSIDSSRLSLPVLIFTIAELEPAGMVTCCADNVKSATSSPCASLVAVPATANVITVSSPEALVGPNSIMNECLLPELTSYH